MKSKHAKNYSPFASIIIVFLTLILPLVYFKSTLDPVLMPRLLFLNILLTGVYLFLLLSKNPAYQDASILRRWLFVLLFGYFAITAVSGFWALNFREGIFDMVKTFSVFSLVAVIALIFNQTINWREKLVKSVVVAAILSLFIGFYQYVQNVILSTNPWLPDGSPVVYSVKGLMAHRNQYAISLMLMLPFTLYGVFIFKNKWKWAAVISSSLILILILLLQVRSVWVGLFVAAIVTFFNIIIFGKDTIVRKKYWVTGVLIALAMGVFSVFLVRNFLPAGDNILKSNNPNSLDPYSAKNINRFKIYNVSTEMILRHPITGVGAGNWKIHSPTYFTNYHFDRDELNWLRPHNDYLWVASEKGIPGLLIFLGIFAITLYYLYKILITNIEINLKIFSLFLMGGVIGYMVVSLFSFPLERINQQVYLSLLIASSVVIYHNNFPDKPKSFQSRKVLFLALPLLIFGVVYGISEVNMEILVKKARGLQMQSNWPGLLSESRKIPQTFKNIDVEGMPINWYPGLAATNMRDFETAIKEYGKAVETFPSNVKVLNNLGQAYIETGMYEKGLECCQRAVSVLNYYPEAFVNMSWAYFKMNRLEESMEMLLKIRDYDRTQLIKQMMNKIMLQDSFLTRHHYDFKKYTYTGSIVSKYQQTIDLVPHWKEALMKKAALKNIAVSKAILEDACYIAQKNEPEKFFAWYGAEYYKTLIRNDSAWMKSIKEKSAKNNIAEEEQLELDANYLFKQEQPDIYKKHGMIITQKQKLLNETKVIDFIAGKAKKCNMSFEEMLDVYAGYLIDLQLRTIDPLEKKLAETVELIKDNHNWYKQVVLKSRSINKPLDETLWREAYYVLMQER